MRLILGFGAGTLLGNFKIFINKLFLLLGDAFLHLLPEVCKVPNWGTG